MKALTICNPYPELILRGLKRVENRTWYTSYRGPLLIHAGKSRKWLSLSEDGTRDEEFDIALSEMSFGAIVGIAHLDTCVPISDIRNGHADQEYPWLRLHEHCEGPWCWVLSGVRRFEPFPYKGAMGLFDVPMEVVDSLREFDNG